MSLTSPARFFSSLYDRFGVRNLVLLAAAALLAVVAGGLWLTQRAGLSRSAPSTNPLIITPKLALETLQAKALYYNLPAKPWLMQLRPELLPEDDRKAATERERSFGQAAQNPKLFRQLDREQHFDALYLAGAPSLFQPLMEHLMETQDWKLAYLDHTSLIFRRDPAQPWEMARLQEVETKLGNVSRGDRALFLAGAASKLVATRRLAAAKETLDRAESLDPGQPLVWSSRGEYHLALGEWAAAVAKADKALSLDADCLEALGVKAQALFSSKRFADALVTSRKLLAKMPENPQILFYHAKIAHEAGQFGEEIDVLRKLIDLAIADRRPTAGYRLYLGQAYARDGEGDLAQRELKMALDDPALPKELRQFANETMALIQKKMKE